MLISQNITLFYYEFDIWIVTPTAKANATRGDMSKYLVIYWPLFAKGDFIIKIRSSMRQKLRLAESPNPKISIVCTLMKSIYKAL